MSTRFRESKATTAKHAEQLRAMLKRPENKVCVDCKRNDPRWASTNLGVFLCIRCSGIHRGLGVHISRVRSVDLDTWSPDQIANMDKWGNVKANLYWEAHLKAGHQPPEHKIESFIRSKYESKRWAMEGPLPDPATLGEPASAESQGASAPTEAAIASPPKRSAQISAAFDLLGEPSGSSSYSSSSSSRTPAVQTKPTSTVLSPPSAPAARATPATASAPAGPLQPAAQPPSSGNGLFDLDFSPGATTAATTAATNANARRNNQDIMSLFGSSSPSVSSQPSTAQQSASQPLDAFASLNLGGGSSGSSFPSYSNNNITSSGYGGANGGTGRAASNSLSGGNPWAAGPAVASAPAPSLSNNFYSNSSSSSQGAPSYSAYSTPANAPSTQNAYTSPTPASNTASLDLFNSADIWGSSNNSKSTSSGDGFGGFSGASTSNKNAFDDLWS